MGHYPCRPRQPAVLHHPCPPAHRIHYPTARLPPTLARLTVPRSFDGDRTRHRVVWCLAPSHSRVAHPSNHHRRHINVQALQNGAVSCQLRASRTFCHRLFNFRIIHRFPAAEARHRPLQGRQMLGHRLSHFRKFLWNLNHHLGHHTSCHIGPALGSLFLAYSQRFVQDESHIPTRCVLYFTRATCSFCETEMRLVPTERKVRKWGFIPITKRDLTPEPGWTL